MDTKKLDKWADLLLDTGKRNNLINFKDTRASTVEVLLPTADALFEKIDGSTSFEVYEINAIFFTYNKICKIHFYVIVELNLLCYN